MAIGDPNAGMIPMLQYTPDGIPKLTINPSTPPSSPAIPLAPPPALSNTNAPTTAGALSPQQGRRANTMLSVQRPDLGIGTNEMLMRVGGRGLANAGRGGLAAYGAMFDEYGNIQDQRRTNALAEYEADYRAQQDEQARLDALELAKINAKAKNAKPDAKLQDQIDQFDATLAKFDVGYGYVQQDGLTGPFDGFIMGFIDRAGGDPKAAKRLILQELKVDDVLLRIAQTKGAISNKEMEIFAKPAPTVELDQEGTWRRWIDEKRNAMRSVRNKLARRAGLPEVQGMTAPSSPATTSGNLSAADAIVGLQ